MHNVYLPVLFSLDTHYPYVALYSRKNVIIVILSQWFSFILVVVIVVCRWIKSEENPPHLIWWKWTFHLFVMYIIILYYILLCYVCVCLLVIGHFVNNVLEVREIVVWFYFISFHFPLLLFLEHTEVEMVCIAHPPCLHWRSCCIIVIVSFRNSLCVLIHLIYSFNLLLHEWCLVEFQHIFSCLLSYYGKQCSGTTDWTWASACFAS